MIAWTDYLKYRAALREGLTWVNLKRLSAIRLKDTLTPKRNATWWLEDIICSWCRYLTRLKTRSLRRLQFT
jgi:hypothetical protein